MAKGGKVLALDFDGVIVGTNLVKSRWLAEHRGLQVAPWRADRTNCVPLIGEDSYRELNRAVYTREMCRAAPPVPGVRRALPRLAARHRLYVVTARRDHLVDWTGQWLESHGLAGCIRRVIAAGGRPKAEILAEIQADALLEDDVRHLEPLRGSRVAGFHYAPNLRVPHRRRDGVTQVRTWKAFSGLVG
jgi:5'(3')-deoxyribonucleotidase